MMLPWKTLVIVKLSLISFVAAFFEPEWRDLLPTDFLKWTKQCRDKAGHDCHGFQTCCQDHGEKECGKLGGMLEYNVCHNYKPHGFDKSNGICRCAKKYVITDYKSKCQSKEAKEDCGDFEMCCKKADRECCAEYTDGMLEMTNCGLVHGKFNYKEALCRCTVPTKATKAKKCQRTTRSFATGGTKPGRIGSNVTGSGKPSLGKFSATTGKPGRGKGNTTTTGKPRGKTSERTKIAGNSSVHAMTTSPSDGKGRNPFSTTSMGQKRSAEFKLVIIIAMILSAY